jgi:thioredoxin-related protein
MKNFLLHRLLLQLRQLGLALMILTWASAALAAQQFPPIDVADDFVAIGKLAATRKAPIMLVFTRPECPYCTRAKKEHLEPLRVSQNYGAKILMREIVAADERAVLRDFDGHSTTHGEFARKYDIRSVPTVLVVDPAGKPLAEPIIGLTSTDFYNLYLEQAIDAGRLALRQR